MGSIPAENSDIFLSRVLKWHIYTYIYVSMILKESLKFIQWKLQINSVKHKNILSEHLKKKVQTHTNQATDGQAGRRLKRIAIVV